MANVYESVLASGGPTPTDITPSNSSPAAMSADGVYKATAAGYAIASYSSKTPSNSSPASLTSGSIYKMSGSGKAVASVTDLTPAPDNESPATITSGTIYRATANGKAVEDITTVTPDDSDPPILYTGGCYKTTGIGYLKHSQGSSLNPTQLKKECVRNTSTTYSVADGYHYIVVAVMRVSGAEARGGVWHVIGGESVTAVQVDSNANATVTLTGTNKRTLNMAASNSSYNVEFRLISLGIND